MIGEINPRFDGYGFSLTGRSHLIKGQPCQDSHLFAHNYGRWQLVAIADGVGSALYSHQGSAAALAALAQECASVFCSDEEEELSSALKKGFEFAHSSIAKLAQENSCPIQDYDTTLTACLYDAQTLFLGHVGDGGVIGIDQNSCYHLLTQVQKGDAWNEVYPLRAGEKYWIFEKIENTFAGLLLLTDGLLDVAVPSLLFDQEDCLYHRFISLFLPPKVISMPNTDIQPCNGTQLEEELQNLLMQDSYNQLTDDLTAAAIWKRGAKLNHGPMNYFEEPNWEALRQKRYHKLYPHLESKEQEENCNASEKPSGAGAAP